MNILFPIETINRELDFKLALAHQLKFEGHTIYFGQHDFLLQVLSHLKGGIYFGKNIFHQTSEKEDGKFVNMFRKQGFDFVYLHEEGAVYKGREKQWEEILKSLYKFDFFNENDIVCEWGDFQKEIDQKRNNQNVPLQTTGHPRFDLYKSHWQFYFEKEVKELKSKFGEFILINGNYTVYNHGLGVDFLFSEKSNYNVDNLHSRMDRVSFFKYAGIQCLSMVELTHALAIKFPDKNFVYRPHPSEKQSFYEVVFKGVPNIIVSHEGAVSSWIIASELLIHDGCTTALEAFFTGKTIINYKPVYDEKVDIWLPNQLGERVDNIEAVVHIIENLNNYKYSIEDQNTINTLNSLMANFSKNSFELTLDVLRGAIIKKEKKSESPTASFIRKQFLKNNIKKELARLKKDGKKKSEYHTRKFYGFDKDYITDKIDILDKHFDKNTSLIFHNSLLFELR